MRASRFDRTQVGGIKYISMQQEFVLGIHSIELVWEGRREMVGWNKWILFGNCYPLIVFEMLLWKKSSNLKTVVDGKARSDRLLAVEVGLLSK